MRLDQLLVQRGLADTRTKAKALVMAGVVEIGHARADKAGQLIDPSVSLSIKQKPTPYVSRGGLKLEAALKDFDLNVRDQVLLDVGASTGGFTDCLLRHGARRVIALDVGYGQLNWKLRQDPRVRVIERMNIRHAAPEDLREAISGAVIDVSFISLRLVVPRVSALLTARAFIIVLIKPQFEAGRGQVGKGGVVRDPALHQEILHRLQAFSEDLGWTVQGLVPSPLLGPKGNREFSMHLSRSVD
jgi:23S rRNA (cytidine1920-2'-O)/16S rRNA (cytidine1409-2'-O)-methyltransferase